MFRTFTNWKSVCGTGFIETTICLGGIFFLPQLFAIALDGVSPCVGKRAEFAAFRLLVGNGTGESAIPIHGKFNPIAKRPIVRIVRPIQPAPTLCNPIYLGLAAGCHFHPGKI